MLALERLVKCDWQCSMESSTDGRWITLQAKKDFNKGGEHAKWCTMTLPLEILPSIPFGQIIKDGWEDARCRIIRFLNEDNEKSAHPDQDFVPDEDSNRTLLAILGFESHVKAIDGGRRFRAFRGCFEHVISLSEVEWSNAVTNHGGRNQAYNFYWGCMVQELLELKENRRIKEI